MRTELLGNLVRISKGKKHELSSSGTRYIQIEDLRHCENIKFTSATKGTEVNDDDVVIVWDGAYSGLASWGLGGLIGSTLARLRLVDKNTVHTPYLGHFIKTRFAYLQTHCTGATIPHLSKYSLMSMKVPLPTLPDQKRIAAILNKTDEIRRKREETIKLADSFLRSVFLEMFGDPIANPKGWDSVLVKDIASVITGSTPSREKIEYYGNAIEWIKSDNINTPHHYLTQAEEGLSELGRSVGRVVPSNSILFTCIAGSPECIGNAAIADRSVSFNQQINALVPRSMSTAFLYVLFLVGKKLIQRASTASMKGMVSKGRFEQISIPNPPKALQERFENIFQHHCQQRRNLYLQLTKLSELQSSLSASLFSAESHAPDSNRGKLLQEAYAL